METSLGTRLLALRDIDGVLGSFLVDGEGQLLALDLPGVFEAAALTSAGNHLARMRAALESAGRGFETCVLRFGDHLLLLRATSEATLCVLCPRGTSLPAVQMGTTLFARSLTLSSYTHSDAPPEDENLPPTPPERQFRGRKV